MADPVVDSSYEYSLCGARIFQLASGSFQVTDNFGPRAFSVQAGITAHGCTMNGNSQSANDGTQAAFLFAANQDNTPAIPTLSQGIVISASLSTGFSCDAYQVNNRNALKVWVNIRNLQITVRADSIFQPATTGYTPYSISNDITNRSTCTYVLPFSVLKPEYGNSITSYSFSPFAEGTVFIDTDSIT